MSILTRNIDKIILVVLLLVYLFLNANLLLFEPSVWPDEAYISDIANNISNENRIGTDLWGNTIVGAKKFLFWYPPVFENTLAVWFKILGLSILNLRILSQTLGVVFLVTLYFFVQSFFDNVSPKKKKLIGLSLILLLIFDNTFLKTSRIGRPEIMVVLLGFLSLYTYQLSKTMKYKRLFYVISGLFAGLAFLTHLIGIFFFLLILADILFRKKIKVVKSYEFYCFSIAFVFFPLFWFVSVLPNFAIFLDQLSLQSSFRLLVNSYIEAVFKFSSIEQKIIYLIYILLSVVCFLIILNKRSFSTLYLSMGLLVSWLICLLGKLEWYPIYLIAFLYPLVFISIFKNVSSKISIPMTILLVVLFFINVKIYFDDYNFYKDQKDAYYLFGQNVKSQIVEGKTVYISTTPDLYFLLKGRNPLYEFPSIKPLEKEYINLLNDSDYMVINFHLERLFVGNLLDKYIEYNKLNEYKVGDGQLYQAQIIELVPKNMRKSPRL